jgi:hypothetical protein
MNDTLYRAEFWIPESESSLEAAIEIEPEPDDAVRVSIRGFSGTADQGTFYLTGEAAKAAGWTLIRAASDLNAEEEKSTV